MPRHYRYPPGMNVKVKCDDGQWRHGRIVARTIEEEEHPTEVNWGVWVTDMDLPDHLRRMYVTERKNIRSLRAKTIRT